MKRLVMLLRPRLYTPDRYYTRHERRPAPERFEWVLPIATLFGGWALIKLLGG